MIKLTKGGVSQKGLRIDARVKIPGCPELWIDHGNTHATKLSTFKSTYDFAKVLRYMYVNITKSKRSEYQYYGAPGMVLLVPLIIMFASISQPLALSTCANPKTQPTNL
jgi:hypothetical protein